MSMYVRKELSSVFRGVYKNSHSAGCTEERAFNSDTAGASNLTQCFGSGTIMKSAELITLSRCLRCAS